MLKEINLNLYKTFINVYEIKNITKTSKKMHLSQPAVSLNLKNLENILNIKLFKKHQRQYLPTNEADVLYASLKSAERNLEDAENKIYSREVYSGKIRIGVQSHVFTSYVSKIIKKFVKQYPNVQFEIWSRSTVEMIKNLDENYLDVVFDTYPIDKPSENIVINSIGYVDNCFFCKYDSDFPQIMGINNLHKYKYILPLYYSKHLNELQKFLGQIEFDSKITCGTTEAIVDLVLDGLGIGYGMYDYIESYVRNKKLRIVHVDENLPKTQIFSCFNKNNTSTIVNVFLNFIASQL